MHERRYTSAPLEVRDTDGQPPKIYGYAAVFYNAMDPGGTQYELWDDLVERIMPGAFDRAIREDDCRGLFNHDPSALLGRKTAGTLRLSVDARGLAYEIDAPDTGLGRDLVASLRRGDLTGSSFAFCPRKTIWVEADGVTYCEIHDVELLDVGPVTYPAYESTTSGVRSRQPLAEADLVQIRASAAAARRASRKLSQRERDQVDARTGLVRLGIIARGIVERMPPAAG